MGRSIRQKPRSWYDPRIINPPVHYSGRRGNFGSANALAPGNRRGGCVLESESLDNFISDYPIDLARQNVRLPGLFIRARKLGCIYFERKRARVMADSFSLGAIAVSCSVDT